MRRRLLLLVAILVVSYTHLHSDIVKNFTFDFPLEKYNIEKRGDMIKVKVKPAIDIVDYMEYVDTVAPFLPVFLKELFDVHDLSKYEVDIVVTSSEKELVDSNIVIATRFPPVVVCNCGPLPKKHKRYKPKWKKYKKKKEFENMPLYKLEYSKGSGYIYIHPFMYDWKTKKLYLTDRVDVQVRLKRKYDPNATNNIIYMRKPRENND